MTRYTNIGQKKTYVKASFDPKNDQATTTSAASTSPPGAPGTSQTQHEDAPVESSTRKRRRKSKGNSEEKTAAESTPAIAANDGERKLVVKSEKTRKALAKLKAKEKAKRSKSAVGKAAASEARRLKRVAERCANKTCFACRGVGHSARDCPSLRPGVDGADGGGTRSKTIVGICYRCGSRKHNLARCRQPAQPDNPLPFASCFVCATRGHLAGSCPRNHGKGVYPNGGSCKLCGETTHLAKDCALRNKTEGIAVATLLGTGHEAGADEDDFHTIRRKNAEMDRDEQGGERARKEAKVRAGALTGVVKAFGKAPVQPKNVVYF